VNIIKYIHKLYIKQDVETHNCRTLNSCAYKVVRAACKRLYVEIVRIGLFIHRHVGNRNSGYMSALGRSKADPRDANLNIYTGLVCNHYRNFHKARTSMTG
jgi:hypothetical protein